MDRETAKAESCPLCGGSAFAEVYRARGYSVARCAGCGLVRTLAVSDDGAVSYPPFDQREAASVRVLRLAAQQLTRERLSFVRRVRPGGRLLDFGCGSGAFARLAADDGYDTVGVEPFSLGRPAEGPRLRLLRAPLEVARRTLGSFDVITLWQVLEHVRDPAALLRALLAHLAPGGALIVSVPNLESWQARVFGAGWFHLDPPRHISHFDRRTLAALLAQLDLDETASRDFHLEYGPVGWVQSALNRMLGRENLLYEFVKDRGALAGLPKGRTALGVLGSLVGGAALGVPAILVEALASSFGAGAVLTVAAERR